ncbi:MAG: hypothetical protein ACE5KE_14590 [Methanosarcinales archaeon]
MKLKSKICLEYNNEETADLVFKCISVDNNLVEENCIQKTYKKDKKVIIEIEYDPVKLNLLIPMLDDTLQQIDLINRFNKMQKGLS